MTTNEAGRWSVTTARTQPIAATRDAVIARLVRPEWTHHEPGCGADQRGV